MSFPNDSWVIPDWQAPSHVKAFTTIRDPGFGHSVGPYSRLNIGLKSGDDPKSVLENRKQLMDHLNLPSEPYWLTQVHGNKVIIIEKNQKQETPEADATVTFTPGIVCVVLTADCLPIFLVDKKGSCVASVHAGWRGLASGVIEEAVKSLQKPGSELLAWLGPGISSEAFVVGPEVREVFLKHQKEAEVAFRWNETIQRWHADLYQLARQRLENMGIRHISGGNFCTYAEEERFFSYRRSPETGRMASLIWIEK